jgi:hypothetical protein
MHKMEMKGMLGHDGQEKDVADEKELADCVPSDSGGF